MSLPATDPDPPTRARTPRPRWFVAVGWALATGLCAGGLWAGVLVVTLSLLDTKPSAENLKAVAPFVSLALAIGGGFAGLLIGECITFISGRSHRGADSVALCAFGSLAGSIGGGLSLPTMLLGERWLHPLASSSALWAILGLFVGLIGCYWSHRLTKEPAEEFPAPARRGRFLTATGWAFATALCTGGAWAATLLVVKLLFGISFPPAAIRTDLAVFLTGSGGILGLIAGSGLAMRSKSGERGASIPALGVGGAFFGALIGAASILTAPAVGARLHPLVSSSLAMAAVGFLAGLSGCMLSRWMRPPATDPAGFLEEEEVDAPAGAKVEWLMREGKRPWRLNGPLVRMFPVFVATGWALTGAMLLMQSAVLALIAFFPLALAVLLTLYRQEERLNALEQRLRSRRES